MSSIKGWSRGFLFSSFFFSPSLLSWQEYLHFLRSQSLIRKEFGFIGLFLYSYISHNLELSSKRWKFGALVACGKGFYCRAVWSSNPRSSTGINWHSWRAFEVPQFGQFSWMISIWFLQHEILLCIFLVKEINV